uniref:MARVEL domain-containing protein n=1 Tax=Parascaris univalens TaxID=6257 RepID=A0A915C425_PARUN
MKVFGHFCFGLYHVQQAQFVQDTKTSQPMIRIWSYSVALISHEICLYIDLKKALYAYFLQSYFAICILLIFEMPYRQKGKNCIERERELVDSVCVPSFTICCALVYSHTLIKRS